MTDLLQNMPPPFNFVVVVVMICIGAGVVTSIAKQVRKYACHRQELALKQELVDRGLSADEIEQIMTAQGSTTRESGGSLAGRANQRR